jgi:C4-type Zn-finger protein
MNITKAQEENTKKIDELKTIKAKFTDTNNQAQIQAIIDELSKSNIESKITDKSSKKKDNTEQHGNRYLIAARMAE